MYTPSQKKASMKWIANNREKWNELCKDNMKKYYENNKAEKKKKQLERYYYSKENSYSEVSKLFRKILI